MFTRGADGRYGLLGDRASRKGREKTDKKGRNRAIGGQLRTHDVVVLNSKNGKPRVLAYGSADRARVIGLGNVAEEVDEDTHVGLVEIVKKAHDEDHDEVGMTAHTEGVSMEHSSVGEQPQHKQHTTRDVRSVVQQNGHS